MSELNYKKILNDIGDFNNYNKITEQEFLKILPELLIVENKRREWQGQLLASLISMRYGLGSSERAHTLNECALAFNISASRVDQSVRFGLRLLQKPRDITALL